MPGSRFKRTMERQGGFSLVELLVVMPLIILLLGVVLQSLAQAGRDQQDIENRSETLTNGQNGLERMTRELRQATWLYFRSSSLVDMEVRVRPSATASGQPRLVRYDCSGETCVRREGTATVFPPPAAPTFADEQTVIGSPSSDTGGRDGQIVGHDVFRPQRVDPATGTRVTDYARPDFLNIRLRLTTPRREDGALQLEDGVNLRNRTQFAAVP